METRVRLSCAVDMQCMVSYVKWYRAMTNGEIRSWGGSDVLGYRQILYLTMQRS